MSARDDYPIHAAFERGGLAIAVRAELTAMFDEIDRLRYDNELFHAAVVRLAGEQANDRYSDVLDKLGEL